MAEYAGEASNRPTERPRGAPSSASGSPFRIYKPGQGQWVRWLTAAGLGVIVIGFGYFLRKELTFIFPQVVGANLWLQLIPPVIVVLILAYLTFYFVGQNRKFVDFMIATEGEMKKVHWSTRQQVLGATRVVIVTVFALAILLFVVDIMFMTIFESIGVLRTGALTRIFGGGEG